MDGHATKEGSSGSMQRFHRWVGHCGVMTSLSYGSDKIRCSCVHCVVVTAPLGLTPSCVLAAIFLFIDKESKTRITESI